MIAVGVDTHKGSHFAVALDRLGQLLGELVIEAGAAGYRELERWAAGFAADGCRLVFGIEGAGSVQQRRAGCDVADEARWGEHDARHNGSIAPDGAVRLLLGRLPRQQRRSDRGSRGSTRRSHGRCRQARRRPSPLISLPGAAGS